LLTRLQKQNDGVKTTKAALNNLKIKPALSLDFPENDITEITIEANQQYGMTTTFMGLYGISSPLPAFYTEELLDEEWDDQSASKDFLDIIHQHLYPLLFQAWQKYRFGHQAVEQQEDKYWDMLYSLIGLADSEFRRLTKQPEKLLPYLGLLAQRQKSALGLQTILKDYIGSSAIEIESCVDRQVVIPVKQHSKLGEQFNTLGDNSVIGKKIRDRMGQAHIHIYDISGEQFQRFLNDKDFTDFIWLIMDFYLIQPLDIRLVLYLKPGATQMISLGKTTWGSLGVDTWLQSGSNAHTEKVIIDRGNCRT
jgi:type VI secretion system protein ImpH